MDSWIGHHREELVKAWGPPAAEVPLREAGARLGSTSITYMQAPGLYTLQHGDLPSTCRMVFHAGAEGMITSLTYYLC